MLFEPEATKGSQDGNQTRLAVTCYKVQEFPEETNNKWGYLLPFQSVNGEFPDIVKKWFSFDMEMRPILYHLIKSIQPKKYFDSVDFLIVVQALEGYHTRFVNPKKVSLRSRINDIVDLFKNISIIENLTIDIKAMVDTRHYYSHFFSYNKKEKIYDGVELYEETKKLKVLLTCCVLHELGISNEKINELLPIGSNPII